MSLTVPALGCLYFWTNPEGSGRLSDQETKFRLLRDRGFTANGYELFLLPRFLDGNARPSPDFVEETQRTDLVTAHIGDFEPQFLLNEEMNKKMGLLGSMLWTLKIRHVVIHAHHFEVNRQKAIDSIKRNLPFAEIWIENNGRDSNWGYLPSGLLELFKDFRDAKFVFDIAHVDEQPGRQTVADYLEKEELFERLAEIHCSFSTIPGNLSDVYREKGFKGYNAFHALYSLMDKTPSSDLLAKMRHCRKVVEGVVPREDVQMTSLSRELEIFSGKNVLN